MAALILAVMACMVSSAFGAEEKGKTIGIIMPTKEQSIWTVQGEIIL